VYGSPENLEQFSDFFRELFGGLGGAPGEARRGGPRGGFRIEDLFGGEGTGPRQPAGQDVEGTIEITLEEAYNGTTRTVTVPASGGHAARSIEVKIPKGVRSGQRIRAAGQGLGGDLYLTVQIAPHPTFTRIQDDILSEVPVPVWTAALGGTVEAPTLGGRVAITIPQGTQDGRTLRLRGRGMPHLRGEGAGDELVKIRLTLPDPLTPRDRELLEEMRRLHEGTAAKP
jgi:curved DNA-binding protein